MLLDHSATCWMISRCSCMAWTSSPPVIPRLAPGHTQTHSGEMTLLDATSFKQPNRASWLGKRLVDQHSDRTPLCEQAEHSPPVKWFGSLGRGDSHRAQVREQRPPVRADMDLRTDQGKRGHSIPLQGRRPLPNPARHRTKAARSPPSRSREGHQHRLASRTETPNRLSKIRCMGSSLYRPRSGL